MRINYYSETYEVNEGELLVGYLAENRKTVKYSNVLEIKAVSINDTYVILAIDTLVIPNKFVEQLKTKFKHRNIEILVCATHTHCAPSVDEFSWLDYPSDVLKKTIFNKCVQAIEGVLKDSKIVSIIEYKKISIDDLANNRIDDTKVNAEFNLININNIALCIIDCHPTILKASMLECNKDFFGFLETKILQLGFEKCILLQGFSGEISRRHKKMFDNTIDDMEYFTNQIIERISAISYSKILEDEISFKTVIFPGELVSVSEMFKRYRKLNGKEYVDENEKLGLDIFKKTIEETEFIDTKIIINLLVIGSLKFIFVNGEIFSGLKNKECINVGLCNGYVGYIIDPKYSNSYELNSSILSIQNYDKLRKEINEIL